MADGAETEPSAVTTRSQTMNNEEDPFATKPTKKEGNKKKKQRKRKIKRRETDKIPRTSFAVEDSGLAPADARRECSNENDPVDLVEVTAVAPNANSAVKNEEDHGHSAVVEDYGLAPPTGVATVDTQTIGDKQYSG